TSFFFFFFFFQAEDGIRDRNVTGVQTCALPISVDVSDSIHGRALQPLFRPAERALRVLRAGRVARGPRPDAQSRAAVRRGNVLQIGRASCRERVEITVVDG